MNLGTLMARVAIPFAVLLLTASYACSKSSGPTEPDNVVDFPRLIVGKWVDQRTNCATIVGCIQYEFRGDGTYSDEFFKSVSAGRYTLSGATLTLTQETPPPSSGGKWKPKDIRIVQLNETVLQIEDAMSNPSNKTFRRQ